MGARYVLQLHLVPVLVFDDGHSEGVGAAGAGLTGQELSQVVAVSSSDLNLEVECLDPLQSDAVIGSLRVLSLEIS